MGVKRFERSEMKKAEALAECLRNLETGKDLDECLSSFPGKEQDLLESLSVWQLMRESMPEIATTVAVSPEAFYMQISRRKGHQGLPLSMKFAALAATATLVSLVLESDTAYGLVLSMSGSLAWLSWWLLSFLPKLYSLKTHSESLSM